MIGTYISLCKTLLFGKTRQLLDFNACNEETLIQPVHQNSINLDIKMELPQNARAL